ncbi:MAG: LCP family protein [Clostridia bacterium]|nr:LCP family protein [Clostridia bacterium]
MQTKYKFIYLACLYSLLLPALFFSLMALKAPVVAASNVIVQEEEQEVVSQNGHNYLLLGIDNASHSSDVIMLAHINGNGKNLKLLQIPRDSYAAGYGKINSIFAKAYTDAAKAQKSETECYALGAQALSSHLSLMLGITVDHHAILTLKDFRTIVDSVGGVPINLPQELNYDDPADGLSIHLKAGEQILDGKAAEGLVRCRNAYPSADYGRMDAQKLFLSAFFEKLRYNTSPIKLLSLIRKVHSFVKTDLSLTETLSLGRTLLSTGDEHLFAATLTGKSVKIGASLCEVLPKDSVREASLWLEGKYNEQNAEKACAGSNQAAKSAYESPAEIPFTPQNAKGNSQ